MPDVFLSYSREDQAVARRFAEGLEREGLSVWWDQALSAGQAFDRVTEKALSEAKAVVVLWSKHSVDSNWVRAEAAQADENGTLVPVQIEPCTIPIKFKLTHTAELSSWSGDGSDPRWRSFVVGLKQFLAGHSSEASPVQSLTPPERRNPVAWIAASVLLAALIAGGLWWWHQDKEAVNASIRIQPAIAVLPFEDMSPNKDQGYLADGLAEEILNSLASIPGLTVFARNSSFEFRTRGETLKQFGKTLGATHLLEGSVRKSGDQLRITAQLIDARTEAHLWSRIYNRPLTDVFKVQEEIANAVSETLQVSLGVGAYSRVPGGTRNVDAWEALVKGAQLAQTGTADSVLRGIEELKRATTLDPEFATAWGRLGGAYGMASQVLPDPPDGSWSQKRSQAFAEARRLAPDAFYLRISDINTAMGEGKWSAADGMYADLIKKAADQGIQLPGDAARADFLWAVGRFREAIALLERERSRNPLEGSIAWALGELHADTGNLPAALAEFDRGTKLGGSYLPRQLAGSVMTALASGDVQEIERRLAGQAAGGDTGSVINAAMAPLFKDRAKALAEVRRLAVSNDNPRQLSAIAYWSAYLGENEYALSITGPQAVNGSWAEIVRLWRPVFSDMRKLPEFKKVVTDLGLVDYWREKGWGEPCQPIAGTDDFECH